MSKKSHNPGPVPPGNRPQSGTSFPADDPDAATTQANESGTGFQEEDPKRRLGDFTRTGEHARQQPGPKNDGGQMHGENG